MKRNSLITLMMLTHGLAFHAIVQADDARPLYVEITEIEEKVYSLQMKVPPTVPAYNSPTVGFPGDCVEVRDPSLRQTLLGRSRARSGVRCYRCEEGVSGETISVRYPDYNPSISTLMKFATLTAERHTVILGPQETTWRLPERETRSRVARQYTALGMEHILGGYDHLLFLVCLLLIARTWRRVLITITGFTLAHSVTLALAALGVVRVPVAPVEAAIALSIVFVATEIARPARDTLTWRNPIAVSASFGLLHGFGFAAVLQEIGLPQTEIPAALLFFNLGVEIGQLLFVSAAIALFLVGRRAAGRFFEPGYLRPRGPALERAAAYAIGSVAALWLLIRVGSFGS